MECSVTSRGRDWDVEGRGGRRRLRWEGNREGGRGKKKRVRVEDKCRVVRFLVDFKVRGGGCS